MSFLYYWRPDNHRRDRRFGFGYHLNQSSPLLAEARAGESVWAFTRRASDGGYVLAAELVVRAVTTNRPGYRYGRYRVWGDLARSRYFDVDGSADAERLIRSLSVRAGAARLGQAFQGQAAVRRLSEADAALLAAFARGLPTEQASIYPEDEFEARLLLGESAAELVVRESARVDSVRQRYLNETVDRRRARRHVESLQELYGGRCQICLYDPTRDYGRRLCHGHHIQWLSRGGEDELENLVLVCPNHRAAIHRVDAAFDFDSASFLFSAGRREPLQLDLHLRIAV